MGTIEEVTIVIPSNGKKIGYYTLAQLSKLTGYHQVYLRRLLLDGKVEGEKVQLGGGPGFWVSTLEAIQKYQTQKDNRGRPLGNNHSS